ncbi:CLC4A protein, partial [Peucedramus taeniatus]|nr:CLC4A protein [Peucedramus taeniatus]
MASEITYAEVKFKNESLAPVKVPPETKKPEQHPQKYSLWLPWLISLLLLLVCIALVIVLLVVIFCHRSEQPSALQQQQQFSQWECDSAVPQGTDRGWTCCPKGWKRFQGNCYFLSLDKMNCTESAQNCTGMGSQLVVITSKAEQDFLSKQTNQPPNRMNFYIGLFEDKVGQWYWVDKTSYNVTEVFWRNGEPGPDHKENCTVIHVPERTLNNWNDVKSHLKHHRICEAAAVIV